MRTKTTLLMLLILLAISAFTQDTVRVNILGKNMVTVVESGAKTDVKIGDNIIDIKDDQNDTIKIRVGRKTIVVSEGKNRASVDFNREDNYDHKRSSGRLSKFKGHWSTVEMGVNSFNNISYADYSSSPNFMDLQHTKSLEFNVNLLKYSIGLQKVKHNIGLVTGLGFNFNDYRFANSYTIKKNENGIIDPVEITDEYLDKSKLSTSFLTAPLLLEFQIPTSNHSGKFFISGGVIGGINLASHTKVKIADKKMKDRNDLKISPFRGGVTARIGYKGFNVYGTYYLTHLFQENSGPVMQPFTIGLGLMNW